MYNAIEYEFFPAFKKKLDAFESLNYEQTQIAMKEHASTSQHILNYEEVYYLN